MKNKNRTETIDESRLHPKEEKRKTPVHTTHNVRDERTGVKEEVRTIHTRGYYSRNGSHDGYNGL
jgi:hypothetical protein